MCVAKLGLFHVDEQADEVRYLVHDGADQLDLSLLAVDDHQDTALVAGELA